MKRFQGGLVFKANGLLYHSTLGPKVKKKMNDLVGLVERRGQHAEHDRHEPGGGLERGLLLGDRHHEVARCAQRGQPHVLRAPSRPVRHGKELSSILQRYLAHEK